MRIAGLAGIALAQDKDDGSQEPQATDEGAKQGLAATSRPFIDDKGRFGEGDRPRLPTLSRPYEDPERVPSRRQAGRTPPAIMYAKPVIWSDWNKFLDAQKTAAMPRPMRSWSALNGGDKAAIKAAFGDLGKNGCGGCHTTFREKMRNERSPPSLASVRVTAGPTGICWRMFRAAAVALLRSALAGGGGRGIARGLSGQLRRLRRLPHRCEHGGQPYAGGRALATPFGTFYSPNITPDPETGIGRWSDAQFLRALRDGVRPDGANYFPAFPYPSFTRITDADARAIKAYLFSLPAVRQANRAARRLLPVLVARSCERMETAVFRRRPVPSRRRSARAAYNRGAYLVTALAHCGECHTPRNWFGAIEPEPAFSPATRTGRTARGPEHHPRPQTGIGNWSDDDIVTAC